MRKISFFMGLIFVATILIVVPYFLHLLNLKLNLFVYSNIILKILGSFLCLCSIFIYAHCIMIFFKIGKGTPAPFDPPIKLVVSGLYKYTRNPIYIANFIVILGQLFIYGSFLLLIYLIFISIAIPIYVIYFEEPKLKKRFGRSYIEYTKKVPRWF